MSFFLVIFLVFSSFSQIYSLDLPSSQISDDSVLRTRMKDSWLIESPSRVMARRPVIETLETGERVQIRAEEGREEFMVIFAREMMSGRIATENAAAMPRIGTGQFPGWAQGSWMLTRRKDTGEGTLIRVFLRTDQQTYIQFRPSLNSERAQMDVVLYGAYVTRSMPIPVPFERLYTMPLNDILRLVGDKFPRRYFDPDPIYYRDSQKFIAQVRSRLGGLEFADDGAINENGDYVFIETLQPQNPAQAGLNCSGFAKWLIDGILRPITGERLTIPPLKAPFGQRGSSFTENWEERRDPYFGLDWIRNLASEANGVLRSNAYRRLEEFEVRADVFSSVENRTHVIQSYPGFFSEAGYGIEGLYPLLYTLAIDEPFKFYLAAINNTEDNAVLTPQNIRGTPRLRQYFHIAALVPYFDEYGIFRIVVFESAVENSFTTFKNRYPGHNINLVQIPVVTVFDP